MQVNPETRTVTLGMRSCLCNNGTMFNIKWCKRTGKFSGDMCELARCPNNPTKKRRMHEISREVVTCGSCEGSLEVPENYCDNIDGETLLQYVSVRVIRNTNIGTSWNEQYLGLGCLWSCTDYGTAAEGTDENLLAQITKELRTRSVQLIKVVRNREDLRLADEIGIYLKSNGYSLRPIFAEVGEKQFAPEGTDQAFGQAVYAAGGNGTLAAALAE